MHWTGAMFITGGKGHTKAGLSIGERTCFWMSVHRALNPALGLAHWALAAHIGTNASQWPTKEEEGNGGS